MKRSDRLIIYVVIYLVELTFVEHSLTPDTFLHTFPTPYPLCQGRKVDIISTSSLQMGKLRLKEVN